jgi:uncharacterized protein GlcG (DUF336 family)
MHKSRRTTLLKQGFAFSAAIAAAFLVAPDMASAQGRVDCPVNHAELESALLSVAPDPDNFGLVHNMWAVVVNRNEAVCAVAFSGQSPGDQWLLSRRIAASKAFTANGLGLDTLALATGNLYGVVIEQGSLYSLMFSNPGNPEVLYRGNPRNYGAANDPMVGGIPGGIITFGGGLALYDEGGIVGGIGVSGDTSCTDHIVAWRLRDLLDLDSVPAGVGPSGTDNLNVATPVTPNTFQQPGCNDPSAEALIDDLHNQFPVE